MLSAHGQSWQINSCTGSESMGVNRTVPSIAGSKGPGDRGIEILVMALDSSDRALRPQVIRG